MSPGVNLDMPMMGVGCLVSFSSRYFHDLLDIHRHMARSEIKQLS